MHIENFNCGNVHYHAMNGNAYQKETLYTFNLSHTTAFKVDKLTELSKVKLFLSTLFSSLYLFFQWCGMNLINLGIFSSTFLLTFFFLRIFTAMIETYIVIRQACMQQLINRGGFVHTIKFFKNSLIKQDINQST